MSITPAADAAPELLALLDALDTTPGATALRMRSLELLGLTTGSRLLDVGCGGGRAVAEAALLGAVATGIDADPRMVAAAQQRWPEAEFAVADACALPFADGSMTAYRADKVYHELPDPAAALAEAHRILAPGGRIALIGQDWDALVIDSDDPTLTRAIVHARADQIPNPRAARRYRNLLLETGFHDTQVEARTGVFTDATILPMLTGLATVASTSGAISPAEAESWLNDQRQRAASQRMFVAVPVFLATATRP